MSLGENIYTLRTRQGLSQGALADALEVSRQSVSKWENNSATPELDKLKKMSELFGVTLDELVSGPSPTEPKPAPAPVVNESNWPTRKIVGTILLSVGLLSLILFAVFLMIEFIIFLSVPLVICGIVCMTVRHHLGLVLCWALYLPFWLFFNIFISFSLRGAATDPFLIVQLVFHILLTAVTIIRMYTGKIAITLWKKVLLTILMLLVLAVNLLFLRKPTDVPIVETTTEDSYVEFDSNP